MKYICIWLIRLYQRYLSPLKRTPTCRFCPTCSAYAVEAFQKRGFFAGGFLTFFRILRCNPFCPGGYDPVPEKGLSVRSYYARAGRRYVLDNDQQEDPQVDLIEEEFPQNAPAAGGNLSDRGDAAAEDDAAPRRACTRLLPDENSHGNIPKK